MKEIVLLCTRFRRKAVNYFKIATSLLTIKVLQLCQKLKAK